MKVIPVLDLLNGQVVQGIGGRRKEYHPINDSVITTSSEPLIVVRDFKEKLLTNWFYIADLNKIQKMEIDSNRKMIEEITREKNIQLMIDAGVTNLSEVEKVLTSGVDQAVLGTETLNSLEVLEEAVQKFGNERIILSLDLKEGQLLANSTQLQKFSPLEIAKKADELNIKAIIVLDLQKVGSEAGPISPVLLKIVKIVKNIPVFTGGGVRNLEDLENLKKISIKGALVATALHKGKIGRIEIEKIS